MSWPLAPLGWLIALSCVCCLAAEPPRTGSRVSSTVEPRKMSNSTFGGEAVVRVEPTSVAVGGTFRLECELRCIGHSDYVHNGFLSEHLELPAQIVITSADGRVRREILHRNKDVDTREESTPWLRLWGGRAIGRELTVNIAKSGNVAAGASRRARSVDLQPGEYYVQAIYNHWLVANWPNDPLGGAGPNYDGTGDQPRPTPGYFEAQMAKPDIVSEPVKLVVTAEGLEGKADEDGAECPLHLELRPASMSLKQGRQTDVEIRMVNRSDRTIEVYNPLLISLIDPRAVVLAQLTADGAYLGDLLMRIDGSWSGPGRSTWVKMPPGGIVSSKATFSAGARAPQFEPVLPPGKYLIELRARAPLLSGPPVAVAASKSKNGAADLNHPSWSEWLRSFSGPEICHSKRIEFELLPRTGD
jgi:hypothetical protein